MPLIPDRWRDYTPFHNLLEVDGVRMIAVKTPLCEVYNKPSQFTAPTLDDLLDEHEQFTPQMLVSSVKEKLGANITCVIDLTFTNRYYSRDHLPKGVFHFKLKCPGRETPDSRICRIFNSQLRKCFVKNADGCIAIHCTHGVNRTGYLMCQYLMKYHGLSPDEAVTAFTDSRGHQIDRAEYVQALHDNAAVLVLKCYPEDNDGGAGSRPAQHGHFNDRYHPVAQQHEHASERSPRHRGYGSTTSSRDNTSNGWHGSATANQRRKDHPSSWSSHSGAATTDHYSRQQQQQQQQKYGADGQSHSSMPQRSHHSHSRGYREDDRSHQPYHRPAPAQRPSGDPHDRHARHDDHHRRSPYSQSQRHRHAASSSGAAGGSGGRDQQQHSRDDFYPPWRSGSSSQQPCTSSHFLGPYGGRRN